MENKSVTLAAQVLAPAVSEIRSLLEASRKNVAQQVNQELLSTYWKDLIAAFQGVDKGAWQGLFALECLQYAAVLSQLSNFPDSVWKIELVALL